MSLSQCGNCQSQTAAAGQKAVLNARLCDFRSSPDSHRICDASDVAECREQTFANSTSTYPASPALRRPSVHPSGIQGWPERCLTRLLDKTISRE